MMKHTKWLFLFVVTICTALQPYAELTHKTVLQNGLTVIVRQTNTLQKVSTQLWINVGSKYENTNERGLAHWLEHMLFKGTKVMSEQDMWLAITKLSGSCNAFTSYDSTHFYIDLPIQHWYEALPILADIMNNCTFKQDLMNAEMQVVIQELKMYKDNFGRTLFSNMMSSIFQDHPYHYPVIGYKNDLRHLNRQVLTNFYKKYYVPSNAVLVIVGNIDPDATVQLVEKYFESISAKIKPDTQEFTHQEDICSQSTIIYRNVKQPLVNMSYVIPGFKNSEPFIHSMLMLALTNMKQSRLTKLLVDDRQLVNRIGCSDIELFDYDLFRISFEPKHYSDVSKIIMLIQKEIDTIAEHGITNEELAAAMRLVESSYYSFLESNNAQAYAIATAYLARHDENFVFERYIIKDSELVKTKVKEFASRYLRPWVMHKGYVLPLPESEQNMWQTLQESSNKEDAEILVDKQRKTELEEPCYSITIKPKKPLDALTPQPKVLSLDNGLTVYYYHNSTIPKINLILTLKANSFYQTENQRGMFGILTDMLQEGTKQYSREKLNKEFSKHGIQIGIAPGSVRMDVLKQEFPKAFELLEEIIVHPTFNKTSLAKIKSLVIADLNRFWDNAEDIVRKLVVEYFYDGHPFSKNSVDKKSILRITQKNLFNFHKQYFSPDGATLIIVGDLQDYNIPKLMKQTIANWKGPKIPDMTWPKIVPNTERSTSYNLEREQVIIILASLSIARNHPDFYKLLLFDIVLHEKLFSLRSKSGAFYSISGSLLQGSGKQPGLVCIGANVSQTRLDEAETMIRQALPGFIESFDEDDLEKAKLGLLNQPANCYSTNRSIAETFAFLHHQKLPFDYYVQRSKNIEEISVDDVKQAVSKVLDPAKLVTFKVGRLNDETIEA